MDNCCVFENNVVGPFPYSNSSGVSVEYGDTGCKIDNNTIVSCSQTGLNLDTSGGGTYAANEVKNNIVQGCAVGLNDQNGIVHTNNLLYSNTTEYQNGAQSAGEIVGSNPLLNSNYTLQAGSPAIDAGCLVGLPFNGNAPDIGAFESAYAGPIPNTNPQATITGQVTRTDNGNPISGSVVSAGTIGSAVTNSTGYYTMQAMPGTYQMMAQASGYGTLKQPGTVVAAGSQVMNFQLTPGQPGVWYVSTTGNDTNDGVTSYSAWASILNGDTKSLYTASVANTIHVLPGTYNESAQLAPAKSGTAAYPITYIADSGATLNFTNHISNGYYLKLSGSSYNTWNGFTVTDSGGTYSVSETEVYVSSSSTNITVKNCRFSSNGYCYRAIDIVGATGCVFVNNVVGPFSYNLFSTSSTGAYLGSSCTNCKFDNNTVRDCSSIGIQVDTGTYTGCEVYNNISQHNYSGLKAPNNNITHGYNIYDGNTSSQLYPATTMGPGEYTTTNVSYAGLNTDSTLQSGSPAIDAGIPITIGGVYQPFNGLWPDEGALESAGTPNPGFATITGTVMNAYAAASGATVTVGPNKQGTATTNASGAYTLLNVPAGSQPMTATLSSNSNSQTPAIAVGSDVVNFNFGTTCVAMGQITDAYTTLGIPGATVSFDSSTATTDVNGFFTVSTFTGSRSFSFSAAGYTNPVGGGSVTLSGSSSPGHYGTLQEICTVNGTITSAAGGSPIVGATVKFGSSSATTASDGTYSISTVTGSYALSITKSGFAADNETVTLAGVTNNVSRTLSPTTPFARISAVKGVTGNTTVVQLTAAKTVTVPSGVLAGNAIYIQETDRTCGIKVVLASGQSVVAGNGIELTGTLETDANGERYIACDTIDSNNGLTTAPAPLLMDLASLGGAAFGSQQGLNDYQKIQGILTLTPCYGTNNIGLLVKTTGLVVSSGQGYFYIDGSVTFQDDTGDVRGVRVDWPFAASMPATGSVVEITGISSCTVLDGTMVRLFRPLSSNAVVVDSSP